MVFADLYFSRKNDGNCRTTIREMEAIGGGDLLCKIFLGLCFIEIGLLCSTYSLIERASMGADCILLVIGLLMAENNGPVEMTAGNIGNPVIYFLGAMATSIAIMSLLKKAECRQIKFLKYMGKIVL